MPANQLISMDALVREFTLLMIGYHNFDLNYVEKAPTSVCPKQSGVIIGNDHAILTANDFCLSYDEFSTKWLGTHANELGAALKAANIKSTYYLIVPQKGIIGADSCVYRGLCVRGIQNYRY